MDDRRKKFSITISEGPVVKSIDSLRMTSLVHIHLIDSLTLPLSTVFTSCISIVVDRILYRVPTFRVTQLGDSNALVDNIVLVAIQ